MSDELNLDLLSPEANRAYLPQPIPAVRDGEIGMLLSQMVESKFLARFHDRLEDGHSLVLRAFAERMASAAVRNRDVASLRLGLIALLLSWRGPDSRDTLTVFPLFLDAISRLDLNLRSFVTSIRQDVGDQLIGPLAEFLKRNEVNRSLQVMGYAEGADDDGFRYIRNW